MDAKHPYQVTFAPTPHSRRRFVRIRFASSVVVALDDAKTAVRKVHPDAHSWTCEGAGFGAEAMVRGVLRGGRIFYELRGRRQLPVSRFYFHAPNPCAVDLSQAKDVRYLSSGNGPA